MMKGSNTKLVREVISLREQLDKLQKDLARLEGRAEEIQRILKEEHDCSSVEEGKKKLAKLEKEALGLEKKFQASMETFEAKWAYHLGEGRS